MLKFFSNHKNMYQLLYIFLRVYQLCIRATVGEWMVDMLNMQYSACQSAHTWIFLSDSFSQFK